jgi:hypothetical protein
VDKQLRELERQAAGGDQSAMQRLTRLRQRTNTRLRGLSTQHLKQILLDGCISGCVPKVAMPVSKKLLHHLRIRVRRVLVCSSEDLGCGPYGCGHSRESIFRVVRKGKYVCTHRHRTNNGGHRLAKQCAKRKARQLVLQAVESGDTTRLKTILRYF